MPVFSIKWFHQVKATALKSIAVYIRNSISFQKVIFEEPVNEQAQFILVEIRQGRKIIMVANFYRPPNAHLGTFISDVDNIISFIYPLCDEILCLSDMNVYFFNLDNPFVSCFETYGLKQYLSEPTRVTKTTCTLLDPILFTNADFVQNVGTLNANSIIKVVD